LQKQAIAIAAQNDGVLCDAVASNCVNNRGQPSPRLSQWWVPTAAPEAGCPFLDGFWKDYKPQEALPCPPSIALPAFVPPVIAPAAAVPSSCPVKAQATTYTHTNKLQAQLHSSPYLYPTAHPPLTCALTLFRTLAAQPPLSLLHSRSRRQRAALDPSSPTFQCPFLPTTPTRYLPSTAKS
jgi:hypothetical protein